MGSLLRSRRRCKQMNTMKICNSLHRRKVGNSLHRRNIGRLMQKWKINKLLHKQGAGNLLHGRAAAARTQEHASAQRVTFHLRRRNITVKQEGEDDWGIEVDQKPITQEERNRLVQALYARAEAALDGALDPCVAHVNRNLNRVHSYADCPDFGGPSGPPRISNARPTTSTAVPYNLIPKVDGSPIRDEFAKFGDIQNVVTTHTGEHGESTCRITLSTAGNAKVALETKHYQVHCIRVDRSTAERSHVFDCRLTTQQ